MVNRKKYLDLHDDSEQKLSISYNKLSAMQSRYVIVCNEFFIDENSFTNGFMGIWKSCGSEQDVVERVEQHLERHSNDVAGVIIEDVYDTEKTPPKGEPPFADLSSDTLNAIQRHNEQQLERIETLRREARESTLQNRPWWQKLLNMDPPSADFF
jgi:hypothetical protein